MIRLAQGDTVLEIDESVGNLPLWSVEGRQPLHAAPWRDDPELQADPDLPMVNKRLAGDFFCMPFGQDDEGGDPPHGLTSNAPWDVVSAEATSADLQQTASARGATITKHLRIDGPALYQTHMIEGGAGQVSFAHHPMTRMADGGRLSFSPKRAVLTDPLPQYAGHGLWALDQVQPGLVLDCEDGTSWDLQDYPAHHAIEDFAILVEAEGREFGWTVVMRAAEDDMLVVLKDARTMPVTMLWISNGGRDFAPWNGRHTGVLGIEDGCAAGATGLSASLQPNPLNAMGLPTARDLGGTWTTRHAMISLPRPTGWSEISNVTLAEGKAILAETNGETRSVPFDTGFFT